MAGRMGGSRPLPTEPEEDTYQYSGYDEGEFSDDEEGGNYANTPAEPTEDDTYQEPGFEKDEFVDEFYENTANKEDLAGESSDDQHTAPVLGSVNSPMVYEEVPPPPEQRVPQQRPPTPSDSTDEEYEAPNEEPQVPYEDVPQFETQDTYEAVNESGTRPPLPAPIQQQDEYLAPGEGGSGPSCEYSEVSGHANRKSRNRPAPPPPDIQRQSGSKKALSSRPLPSVPSTYSKNMSNYPWYFGDIDRHKATEKIKSIHQDGAYLVRSSKTDPNSPYTLAIFYKSRVWNLHIHIRSDKKFAIGAVKPDEQSFANIVELIEYHQVHNIILMGQNGGETRLIKHPKK